MPGGRVHGAREDEEEVGEPVQVDKRQGVQGMDAGGLERLALGATADSARDVETRRSFAPSGKHEALELRQLREEPVPEGARF